MTGKILLRAVLVIVFVGLGMVVFAYLKATNYTTSVPNNFPSPATVPTTDTSGPLLPLPGSVSISPETKHAIPFSEVERACHTRDCLQAINAPKFLPAEELGTTLSTSSLGILLSYKQEQVFYPVPMLEAHVVVNDIVAEDPILVTYDALSGAAIVYDRAPAGVETNFGVSGLLWQNNVLLYNQAETVNQQNLWSQLSGTALIGPDTGEVLSVLPSDIIDFGTWLKMNPKGKTFTTGYPTDLQQIEYYAKTQQLQANFAIQTQLMEPETYVYGITVAGHDKAYPKHSLPIGKTVDKVADQEIVIEKSKNGEVVFTSQQENNTAIVIPDVEVFWFAWVTAHPETLIWQHN